MTPFWQWIGQNKRLLFLWHIKWRKGMLNASLNSPRSVLLTEALPIWCFWIYIYKDIFILLQIEIYVRITDPSLFRTITSIIISTRLGLALYTTKKNEKDKQRITKTPSCYVVLVFCKLNGGKMMELDSANLRIYPVSKYIRNNVH